ncbi:MAG TPA: response regulator [Bacteroidetes bacterium]|nr:chemotaxis protein CheY [bacterium BMS3Bbin04]HDO64837.1 response regulator [Bacteroidota bacterium]HEX03962.1 response regulator [Bacteroidota bacterium]
MRKDTNVLVLDDEDIVCRRLKDHLVRDGYTVEAFTESEAALARLQEQKFDVIVTDYKMSGPTGMDVLRIVKDSGYATEVIMITGYASIETFRHAEVIGVYKFVAKPFKMKEVAQLVKKAVKKARKKE